MRLIDLVKKPDIYTKNQCNFWDDTYISQNMLNAHLNSSWDAASRNFDFIDQSVEWISQNAPLGRYKKILDLGCGPGLYSERLNKRGYFVTGIDFSKRSIDYARKQNFTNTYLYQNYLEIDYENEYDLVLLIYCDYAVLSPVERKLLLQKILRALKKGGKLIFDVFTPARYEGKKETMSWSINEEGGFWNPRPYISIEAHYIYDNHVHLDQHAIIDEEDNGCVYRIWDTAFTKDMILKEIEPIGYSQIDFYSDVSGNPFREEFETMCIVLEK